MPLTFTDILLSTYVACIRVPFLNDKLNLQFNLLTWPQRGVQADICLRINLWQSFELFLRTRRSCENEADAFVKEFKVWTLLIWVVISKSKVLLPYAASQLLPVPH